MNQKIPHSPFTTRLSGSAKETELRIRNIFQWKKKRPPVPLFLLTAILVLSCCGLVSCQAEKDESSVEELQQDAAPAHTPDYLSEIGKTFDLIREENPDIEYQAINIPNASGQCLGQAQGQFLYFFFGAQDSPSLEDLSAQYGHQLKCAGIVSTVGEVYPETTEDLPLEQFFSAHHIPEYTYNLEDTPSKGWIEFSLDDYLVWINTNDSGAYSSDYTKVTTMKRSYPVVIIDLEILNDNNSIRDKYWTDTFGSNHITVSMESDVLNLLQEPPLSESDLALAVPDFLTEEQQLLYRRARNLYEHAFGADTSFIEYPETMDGPFSEYETLERNDHIYTRSQGRYSGWALFDAVIHSAFTDSFIRLKNAENLYIEHNGYLYFVNAARGCGYYYNDNFPDKFRLIEQTDTSIEFVVIGHYSEAWPKDGETTEARNRRLEREYEYTWEFPIIMVLTEHGWRFDQFYSPLTDEVGPENAAERASNDTSAMELFQSVLTGGEFIDTGSGETLTLDQLRQSGFSENDTYPAIPEKFAVVDMDHDGTTEVVLQLKIGAVAKYLILHVQNETVYGYSAGARSLMDLKTDGTFEWSGGAFDCGSASIRFTEYFYTFNGVTYREPYTTDKITYCDSRSDPDGKQLFFADGASATADEFEVAISVQQAKPGVVWYEITNENMKILFTD